MPNKRAPGKAQVNAWVPEGLKHWLKARAETEGVTHRELMERLLTEGADRMEKAAAQKLARREGATGSGT